MSDKEYTCDVAGRIVRIRHAEEYDLMAVSQKAEKHGIDNVGFANTRFVVVEEDGEITGFGSLKEMGDGGQMLCVFTEKKMGGVTELMVKHLLEHRGTS